MIASAVLAPTAAGQRSHRATTGPRTRAAFRGVRATCRALPAGGLWTLAILAGTHAVLSLLVFPHAVAQPRIRQKVLALTSGVRPALIVAGDSRGHNHVDPTIIEDSLGMPINSCVNLAMHSCGIASTTAWYREFSDRFAASPIMLLSISDWLVGPRAGLGFDLNREYYAERGAWVAVHELEPYYAVRSLFMPEWTMLERITPHDLASRFDATVEPKGFAGLPMRTWVPRNGSFRGYAEKMRAYGWFGGSTDAAWYELRSDLAFLQGRGVQLVVLDSPIHPDLSNEITGTGTGDGIAYDRFRSRLAQVCDSLTIPLLRYDARDLGYPEPAALFYDGLHLNSQGAAILSELIADDLRRLIARHALRVPYGSTQGPQ